MELLPVLIFAKLPEY